MRLKNSTILGSLAVLSVPAICFGVGGADSADLTLLGCLSFIVSVLWVYAIVTGDLKYAWNDRRYRRTRLAVQPQWCSCRSGMPIQGWRCTFCHKPVPTWRLAPSLLARRHYASHGPGTGSTWKTERQESTTRLVPPPAVIAAAVHFVQIAQVPGQERPEFARQVMADAAVFRRLYVRAAHRLHPDHNGGVHLTDWFALQSAVELLRRFHEAQDRVTHPRPGQDPITV